MPRRATDLTPERHEALLAELRVYNALLERADLDVKVHVARSMEVGMPAPDIATELGIHRDTVYEWRRIGEAERERRREGADT